MLMTDTRPDEKHHLARRRERRDHAVEYEEGCHDGCGEVMADVRGEAV